MNNSAEILLIDDDEDFCRSVKAYFEREGIRLATLSDSLIVTAIDLTNIKVVLLDLDMPLLNGRQVLDQLPPGQSPLVIIVSGHGDIDTRLDLLGSGADFFLSKPVDLGELCLIAKKALGRHIVNTSSATTLWILQRHQMCIFTPYQQTFGLSGTEFRVLEKLFRNVGEVTGKEILIEVSTGSTKPPTLQQVRSLEVLLSRLRRRFSTDTVTFPVKSLRNVGYIFHGNCQITD
jgi:DNA-binding response OmpR family regulator